MGAGMAPPRTPRRSAHGLDLRVVALGIAVLAVIVGVDVALRNEVTLTPWVLIAPLFVAMRGTERETAVVAVIALAASVGLGAVNDTFGESIHFMHMALVAAGGSIAVVTARDPGPAPERGGRPEE